MSMSEILFVFYFQFLYLSSLFGLCDLCQYLLIQKLQPLYLLIIIYNYKLIPYSVYLYGTVIFMKEQFTTQVSFSSVIFLLNSILSIWEKKLVKWAEMFKMSINESVILAWQIKMLSVIIINDISTVITVALNNSIHWTLFSIVTFVIYVILYWWRRNLWNFLQQKTTD